jgi:putative membrane protein insertion efficiency factor
MKFLINLPKTVAIKLIDIYQLTLSPDHSWLKGHFPHGYCKFYPTCSEYSKQSFEKFGFIKGLILTTKRVSRCHPWAEPKVDLVPVELK